MESTRNNLDIIIMSKNSRINIKILNKKDNHIGDYYDKITFEYIIVNNGQITTGVLEDQYVDYKWFRSDVLQDFVYKELTKLLTFEEIKKSIHHTYL